MMKLPRIYPYILAGDKNNQINYPRYNVTNAKVMMWQGLWFAPCNDTPTIQLKECISQPPLQQGEVM